MRISVTQIYIEAGVNYPFSCDFQVYVGERLTERITPSDTFVRKYGADFDLTFNMSAKAGLTQSEIRGPTVFRRDKDVEYTIFLPFDEQDHSGEEVYRRVLKELILRIVDVLKRLQMDVSLLLQDSDEIIETILKDPRCFENDP